MVPRWSPRRRSTTMAPPSSPPSVPVPRRRPRPPTTTSPVLSARPRDPAARSCKSTRSAGRRSLPSPTPAKERSRCSRNRAVSRRAGRSRRSTGAWSGRYLVGLGGTISGFAITADGDWTLTVEQRSSALFLDAAAGVSGRERRRRRLRRHRAWPATVSYDGTGPIVVRAATVSGVAGARQPARPVHRRRRGPRRPRLRHHRSPRHLVAPPPAPSG